MKRYIDEKTGKIVNILEKEEANKVVKILIDYFFSEASMPAGRLNLVGFLSDFIKLGNIEDLNKIVEYIGEYKKNLKLSKEDEVDFEVLYKFFRMYKDLEESKLGIEDATNYISEMTNKKEELSKKDNKEMTKKDKILKVFFDNGFEFKRLAKVACEAWENHIKEQINSQGKEVYVSLEQEIAYQDLLEFASSENVELPTIEDKKVETEKKEIQSKLEEKKSENAKFEDTTKNLESENKVDVNVQIPEVKEPVKIEIVTKTDEKTSKPEQNVSTIQINHLAEDDELMSSANVQTKTHDEQKVEKKADAPHKITQHDITSLLGLDDDLLNNSNNVQPTNTKEEKIHTIHINPIEEDDKVSASKHDNNAVEQKSQVSSESNVKKEQGYTSNIHIHVPGIDKTRENTHVTPEEVKKATENVDLKESADFLNNVLDDMTSRNIRIDEDSEDGFRD